MLPATDICLALPVSPLLPCARTLLPQDRLFPAMPSDQASLYSSRPASKGMRGMGASYDFGSRDHIFEQGLL
jgi:hypothetical protein